MVVVPQQPVQYQQIDQPVQYAQPDQGQSSWKFLDSIDPLALSVPHDLKLLKAISKQFVDTVVLNIDTQSRMQKLLQILQMVIRLISAKSAKRKQKIRTLQHELGVKRPNPAQKSQSSNVVKIIASRCPVCQLGFKTLTYLDMHMFSKHKDVAPLWQALRTPQNPSQMALPEPQLRSPTPITSPKTPQGIDKETIQAMFDDFRKQYEGERRDDAMQAQALIRQEMEKLAAKVDDLSHQAQTPDSKPRQSSKREPQQLSPHTPTRRIPLMSSEDDRPSSRSSNTRKLKMQSDSSSAGRMSRQRRSLRTPPVKQTPPERESVQAGFLSESDGDEGLSLSSTEILDPRQQTPAPEIDVPNLPHLSRASSRQVPLESFLSEVKEDEESWSEQRQIESSSFEQRRPKKRAKKRNTNPFDDESEESSTRPTQTQTVPDKPEPQKRKSTAKPTKVPFDDDSDSKLDWDRPEQQKKKSTTKPTEIPFDGDSDSRLDWDKPEQQKKKQMPKPTEVPFDGDSDFNLDSDKPEQQKKKPAKTTNEAVFDHDSDSKTSELETGEIVEAPKVKEHEAGEIVEPPPAEEPEVGEIIEAPRTIETENTQTRPRRLLDVGELPTTPNDEKKMSDSDDFPFDLESSGSLGARRISRRQQAVAPSFDSNAEEESVKNHQSESDGSNKSQDFDGFDVDDIDLGDV